MREHVNTNSSLLCQHAQTCSGCSYFSDSLESSLQKQRQQKIALYDHKTAPLSLSSQDVAFEYANPFPLYYRNHLDFTLDHGSLGLFHIGQRQITDITECLVLEKSLLEFYQQIKPLMPLDKKGSVRLRHNGKNDFGLWLDFSNLDIKEILDDSFILQKLTETADSFFNQKNCSSSFQIEMGQKGKVVGKQNNQFKLMNPLYHPWFFTLYQEQEIPLLALIRSFTQSGLKNNFSMMKNIQDYFRSRNGGTKWSHALEMGAGIGNLTFPFLEFFESITCFEFDPISVEALAQTQNQMVQKQIIQEKQIHVIRGDFHQEKNTQSLDLNQFQGLILNPARSGVGKFLLELQNNKTVEVVFFMSCYLETFAEDAHLLQQAGFHCDQVFLFDQFSFSKHFEILSFWFR